VIRVKICGITRKEDALLAARLGASAIGFIFYPRSRRYVEPALAGEIARTLPPFVAAVGVFVDPTLEEVESVLRQVPLSGIQLHGNETPQFCTAFRLPVIKGFRVGPEFDVGQFSRYRGLSLLLDGFDPRQPGGSGKSFDWRLARLARRYGPIIIAGGLRAENVAEAVGVAKPDAVDISSGVESEPGRKDPQKLLQLFDVIDQLNQGDHEPT